MEGKKEELSRLPALSMQSAQTTIASWVCGDRVLPIGLRSAPYIFNCLAEAIEWLAKQQGIRFIHLYLDDFFITAPPNSTACHRHLHTLTALCSTIGVPLAEEKLEGPATTLEYLGITLDSSRLEARLPSNKLEELQQSLVSWTNRSDWTKQELLSLIGTLTFATKVVPAGRTFLRRMINLSTTASSLHDTVSLTEDFMLDIQWWQAFATPWTGRSFFLLPDWTLAPDLELFTDGSGTIGYGAFMAGDGSMTGGWQTKPHIASSGKSCTP